MSLNLLSSLTSSTQSSLDLLVAQYKASISQPLTQLQNQRASINSLISTFQDLKSKLSALVSQVQSFQNPGSLSPLAAKTVSSSNSNIATATAQSTAVAGTHTLLVTQLAKNDTLLSNRLTQSGTDISTATGAGTFTFSITVNGKSTNVNVTVKSGDTNATVLANIAAAVNAAGAGVVASVVNDTSTTSRLVFTSSNSGSTNTVSVSDVTGTLAQSVGWSSSVITNRTASTSTTAGYVYSAASSLDANFTLDGIPIVRGTNSISDVLTGVTLNLLAVQQPTDNPLTLTVEADTTSIQNSIQSFINAYNAVITTLSNDITTNTQTLVRGPLAGDITFMSLQRSLQSIAMSSVSTVQSGSPNMLSSIGITINKDGTLTISSSSTLTSALNANLKGVSDLLSSSGGIMTQIYNLVNTYSTAGGIVDQKINGAQDQVNALNDQIKMVQTSINMQADAMRQQYTGLLTLMAQLNQTQSQMNRIYSMMGLTLG